MRVTHVMAPARVPVPGELERAGAHSLERLRQDEGRVPELAPLPLRSVSRCAGSVARRCLGAVEAVPCPSASAGPTARPPPAQRRRRPRAQRGPLAASRTRSTPTGVSDMPRTARRANARARRDHRPRGARPVGDLRDAANGEDHGRRSSGRDEACRAASQRLRQHDDRQHGDGDADGAGAGIGQISDRDGDAYARERGAATTSAGRGQLHASARPTVIAAHAPTAFQ